MLAQSWQAAKGDGTITRSAVHQRRTKALARWRQFVKECRPQLLDKAVRCLAPRVRCGVRGVGRAGVRRRGVMEPSSRQYRESSAAACVLSTCLILVPEILLSTDDYGTGSAAEGSSQE